MTAPFNVACAEAQEHLLDLLDELSSYVITTEYYNQLEFLGDELACRRRAIVREFEEEGNLHPSTSHAEGCLQPEVSDEP